MNTTEPTGTRRDDPILSLDPTNLPRRAACIAEANRLRAEAADSRDWDRIAAHHQEVQVGDLVMELTRAAWSKDPHYRKIGFGYLVAIDGDTHYIQYGPSPDDIAEWGNAMLVRVPDEAVTHALNA